MPHLRGNNITMRFYMRKIKGLRWYMIALVTLGTVLGYLT
jgi:ACS family hexuronate transporter-like MFS transporter